MRGQAARYAAWLDLAGELLNRPADAWHLECPQLAAKLNATIGAPASSWNAVDAGWAATIAGCWPEDFIPRLPPGGRVPTPAWQPLLAWYAHTRGTAPQTLARVPDTICGRRMLAEWVSFARPLQITHQLSIPVWVTEASHFAFVLARPDHDFSEDDLELAARVQPILAALYRQDSVLQHQVAPKSDRAVEYGLTAREYAVLGLLAQGLTAEAIARRLAVSPRTVQKHLERLYRKLGVQDRLMAVARAMDAHLLTRPDHPGPAYAAQRNPTQGPLAIAGVTPRLRGSQAGRGGAPHDRGVGDGGHASTAGRPDGSQRRDTP